MSRLLHVPVLVLVLVGTVHAAPPGEQLTKDEIKAAADAAVAALPKVDAAAAEKCRALPVARQPPGDAKPDELAAVAACFRAAGSLGLAIQTWRSLIQHHPHAKEAVAAALALGPAYEAAGRYEDAAQWNATYAKRHGREQAAFERMTRAICTWRQLGITDEAVRGFKFLRATWGAKRKVDEATLCKAVQPITVPAKP